MIAVAETLRHGDPEEAGVLMASAHSVGRNLAMADLHHYPRSASSIADWHMERDIGLDPARKPDTD